MLDVRALAERVVAREPAGVASAISIVEDRRPTSESTVIELLRALRASTDFERSERVGITGPPGVGKSSLVSALGKAARAHGLSVGVLAVDPSSPRSGGALLGDRARIDLDPNDTNFFVRSMASGGELGGLARAAAAAVDVLSAAYDLVLVETTGVGQSETDVEHVTDCVVMVIQPGSGDVLQFLKAGILEVPDVFVVNKADLGDVAERALSDLHAALGVVHLDAAAPPVLATSVPKGRGIDELFTAIRAHRGTLEQTGRLRTRREQARAAWAARLFRQRYGEVGVERVGGQPALRALLLERAQAGASAVEAVSDVARSVLATTNE